MLLQQGAQAQHAFGESFDREGHVLDHAGGAHWAGGAHRGEEALAHRPVGLADGGVAGEAAVCRRVVGGQRGVDLLAVRGQLVGAGAAGLDQQRGRTWGVCGGDAIEEIRQPGLALHRQDAGLVHQLHRIYCPLRLEGAHRLAGGLQFVEQHQSRSLVRVVRHGVVRDAGDEAQRALRADHQVGQHVHRIDEVDQRIDAVAGGVLQPVLAAHLGLQRRVAADAQGQRLQPGQQVGMAQAEGRHAGGVGGVEQRAVAQHHPQRGQRVVTVLRGAAAHARAVVGGDATDAGGGDRCRIRPDLAAVAAQCVVRVLADHPGLQADARTAIQHLDAGPAFLDDHQHRVAHRLSGQAGARSTQRHRHTMGLRQAQHDGHLPFIDGAHHDLRQQAVEARVGAVGQRAGGIGDQALGRHVRAQGGEEGGVLGRHGRLLGGPIACCGAGSSAGRSSWLNGQSNVVTL